MLVDIRGSHAKITDPNVLYHEVVINFLFVSISFEMLVDIRGSHAKITDPNVLYHEVVINFLFVSISLFN